MVSKISLKNKYVCYSPENWNSGLKQKLIENIFLSVIIDWFNVINRVFNCQLFTLKQ